VKKIVLLLFLAITLSELAAQTTEPITPVEYIYSRRDTLKLKADVFIPPVKQEGPYNAIIIFYGGGWVLGDITWAYDPAQFFTKQGLVSVAVSYRLSDQKTITPLDAMEDARDAIRWMRANAAILNINPDKIVALGWSAGAHLAASTAIFNASDSLYPQSCVPNALILESPALSLLSDRWFRNILLGKEDVRNVSPDEHVRPGLPPTILLQGDLDTMTPLAGTERFYRRMLENGNQCKLKIYKNYGHLFTPGDLPDNNWPETDPKIRQDAVLEEWAFLKSIRFVK